jgi:phage/plasmid primase-like uncharacterized protein
MSKHRNPRENRHSNYTVADLKNLARGRWLEILRAAGVPADALDGRKGRPCPRCGGVDRYCPLPDLVEVGAVLCRHCHNASSEPRCGDGVATLRWWLGCDAASAVAWLADWIGVGVGSYWTCPIVHPVERRLSIPDEPINPKRFELMADVWRRKMRPKWLMRAADLLELPVDPLRRLQVGWSLEHRATTWPMRDAAGDVIGVRLRCPSTAKKWAVRGSRAGLFYPVDLLSIERHGRLYVTEGPTDTAALLSIGLSVVGVPSAGGACDLLVKLTRRLMPIEVIVVADADGPGLAGAERTADAVMIVAPVRILSPVGCKDARAWVCAGADRSVIESAAEVSPVRCVVMEGSSNE